MEIILKTLSKGSISDLALEYVFVNKKELFSKLEDLVDLELVQKIDDMYSLTQDGVEKLERLERLESKEKEKEKRALKELFLDNWNEKKEAWWEANIDELTETLSDAASKNSKKILGLLREILKKEL